MIKPWLIKKLSAGTPGSGTFYPAVTADDYQWYSGGLQYTNNWTGFGYHDQSYHAGFRFTNVTIPQGATITQAYMIFTSYDDRGNDPHLHIYGNDADNATAPTTDTQANALVQTTAYADWSPESWYTNTVYNSPSLVDVVKEIVDRAGWSSGNAMQMLVINQGAPGASHTRDACDTSYSSGTKKTGLYVEWTA